MMSSNDRTITGKCYAKRSQAYTREFTHMTGPLGGSIGWHEATGPLKRSIIHLTVVISKSQH